MPVDKFGRRASVSTAHRTAHRTVHHIITNALNKDEDLMLEIGSDDNRSLGCVDLTPNKSFTLNLGDIVNKLVYTKDQGTTICNSHGLGILDSNNVPVFEFDVDGKNKMSKELDCRQNFIRNLPDPINPGDAVNKHYFTEYIRQHRRNHELRNILPNEPFTDIVLLRYNPRRPPTMLSMYVEEQAGTWVDVSCGYFLENWKNFKVFIKDNCIMCRFTAITGGPWTRNFILNYMIFLPR